MKEQQWKQSLFYNWVLVKIFAGARGNTADIRPEKVQLPAGAGLIRGDGLSILLHN